MKTIRKALLSLACVFALGAGSSLAQSNNLYGAGSLGLDIINGGAYFNINSYLGFEDLISEGIDLRANLGLITTGNVLVQLGTDVLFGFQFDETSPITIYAGGGPIVVFGGATDFGLGAVGNFDYALQPDLSLFGEFNLDFYFRRDVTVAPGLEVGAKYKF